MTGERDLFGMTPNLLKLAHMFARVVSIASGYHLDAAAQRKDAA